MKKLALLVMLALVVAVPAYAQLGDTDNSSFTIQNLGQNQATVTVTFYDESGNPSTPDPILTGTSNPFTLAPGAGKLIVMPAVLGLADGRYSVVIESTEPIGVVTNLKGESAGGAPFYNGSYSGFSQGAMEIFFPATHYEYYDWNSLMSIQNTTANPINVAVTIYNDSGSVVATKNYNGVPAFSSVHLDMETEGAGLGLATNLNGSAKVACTGACVGTDNQTADGGFTQSYNAFLAGGTKLYAPALYNNYYSWNGSLKVQNIGSGATNIGVTYYIEGGATCVVPATSIAAGQALFHHLPSMWGGWGCPGATNKAIGAVVTSSATDVVGVVNAANPKKQGQTYSAIGAADGAAQVGLPVIMNDFYGWYTSFTCQNVQDSGTANATYAYSGIGCPGGGCSFVLGPGETAEVVQKFDGGLAGNKGEFSVTVTATGAQIACIANETHSVNQQAGTGDWSMSYNGFGQ
jgi:hypothetical protein